MKPKPHAKALPVIRLEGVSRDYGEGELRVRALHRVSFEVAPGEFTAVVGPSGSGKTTLLNLIGGLDMPSEGRLYLEGRELGGLSGDEQSDLRRDKLGFIFQAYNLVPVLTVRENVEYVLLLQGLGPSERRDRVSRMLKEVGLAGKEDRFPNQLSGGQQQRVAVARAMVGQPSLILADEPTANLDSASGAALLDLMRRLNEEHGKTFLFSTHDPMVMDRARRLVTLKDGRVAKDQLKRRA